MRLLKWHKVSINLKRSIIYSFLESIVFLGFLNPTLFVSLYYNNKIHFRGDLYFLKKQKPLIIFLGF